MDVDRILAPTDFSPCAGKALEHAIDLAKVFSAKIHLLHSFAVNPGSVTPYSTGIPVELVEGLYKAAAERLAEEAEKVKSAGVEVEQHLEEDYPSQAIITAAEKLSTDLIVMGTRGMTGLKHIVLGSTAERVVRTAPCPVLTVAEET